MRHFQLLHFYFFFFFLQKITILNEYIVFFHAENEMAL